MKKYFFVLYVCLLIFLCKTSTVSAIEYGHVSQEYDSDSCFRHRTFIYDEGQNATSASTFHQWIYNSDTWALLYDSGNLSNVATHTSPCLNPSELNIWILTTASKSGYGGEVKHIFWNGSNAQNTQNGQRLSITSIERIYLTPQKTEVLQYPANNQMLTTKTITARFYADPYSNGDIDHLWLDYWYSNPSTGSWDWVSLTDQYGSEASPLNLNSDGSGNFNAPTVTIPNPLDGYYYWGLFYLDQDPPIITNIWQSRVSKYWGGHPGEAYFYLATDLSVGVPTVNGTLTPGSSLTFSSVIRNIGADIIARASTARFRLDINNDGTWDTTLGTRAVNQLNPAATQTVTSPSWISVGGIHKVEVCADYNAILIDVNRGNNCTTTTFTVGTPTGTPTPTRTNTPTPTTALTGTPTPTRTGTPTPTRTGTPTPITNLGCNLSCTGSSQCASGYCYLGLCRNLSCPTVSSCTCSSATFTPTPTPANGTIQVCKILMDQSGNVTDGSTYPSSTFRIEWFIPSPPPSTGPAQGLLGTSTFSTPLTLDTALPNFPAGPGGGNNAQCFLHPNVPQGNYYYRQESISGSSWGAPLYDDSFLGAPTASTITTYSGELFDSDPLNDNARNRSSDGMLNLDTTPLNRTLVVENTYTPTCSFDLVPNTVSMNIGIPADIGVSSPLSSSPINRVEFSSDSPIVTVAPTSDASAVYMTTATANSIGTATITADMYVSGALSPTCSRTASVNVTGYAPWWQVKGSDAVSNGDIRSLIPSSCISPSCSNSLITFNSASNSGIAIAGGTIDAGTGTYSSPYDWSAIASYADTLYNTLFFSNKFQKTAYNTWSPGTSSITASNLSLLTSGPLTNGYYYVKYSGAAELSIDSNLNLGSNRVVLLVENAGLAINGTINVTDGEGMFMVIAKGDIHINPLVRGSSAAPGLEGVFFTEQNFYTGTVGSPTDQPLYIRGSVVAFNQVVPERNLSDNSTTPGEVFEWTPDVSFLFPTELGAQSISWAEVSP